MNNSMTAVYRQFVALLRCGGCGGEMPAGPFDWESILYLAKRHRVEGLLHFALKNAEEVPDAVRERLQNEWRRALVQDARQEHDARLIGDALATQQIPFAPMKGLVLKNDYPSRELRWMSDLDFYILPEDRERIHAVMESLDAVVASTDSGDINYAMPGNVCVEFHGMLLYRAGSGGVGGYSDWSRVMANENRLTEEGYALNLIGHVAYNLAHAGCGARFILDLWVYRHKHPSQPDWNKVMDRLKQDGLDHIAQNVLDLSEYWFGDGLGSELLDELGAYVLEGGLYGLRKRDALSSAGFHGGKLGAIRTQLFRSRDEFENRYPWLKKYPFLLPVAWVMRGAKSLQTHRVAMGRWTRQLNQNNGKEIEEQKARLKRFGFNGM